MSEIRNTDALPLLPPGVYEDLLESQYRSDPGVSQSELKCLARSPAHYRAGLDEEREDTDALILGRIVGQLAIEPDRKPWWTVRPENLDLRTKAGKEWAKENPNPISHEMWTHATRMATALLDHPVAGDIIKNSKREVSVFDNAEVNVGTIRRKARIDLVTDGSVLADIKTTLDAREHQFRKSIRKFGYHIQAWSYRDIWNSRMPDYRKEHFLFIAIEKTPPYGIQIHHMHEDFMAEGGTQYLSLLNQFAKCQQENVWPGYSDAINVITP